jgi:hypothetical protein
MRMSGKSSKGSRGDPGAAAPIRVRPSYAEFLFSRESAGAVPGDFLGSIERDQRAEDRDPFNEKVRPD